MSIHRYSVYTILNKQYEELQDIQSNKDLLLFLNKNKFDILIRSSDDRFKRLEEAETFAQDVYPKDSSKNVIAIYDRQNKSWINGWFL